MNRINQLFEQKHDHVLDIYFCAGYPHLDSTLPTLQALQDGGIDMVEVGIPFSDPMADGPVIQTAATQALQNGMSLHKLFDQLKEARPMGITMPIILMGYLNVIYQYGFEAFCKSCQECGVDGAIIPDLPFDIYMRDYKATADRYDIKIIMLITPETSPERIRLIDEGTDGFIYEVSTDATTGAQREYDAGLLPPHPRHEAAASDPRRIWHLQQGHPHRRAAICRRCHHRQQVRASVG